MCSRLHSVGNCKLNASVWFSFDIANLFLIEVVSAFSCNSYISLSRN